GDAGTEILASPNNIDTSTATASGDTSTGGSSLNTLGEQKTVVMLVNFQNDPANRPWTFDQVLSAYSTVSDFLKENSYQQTWLSTAVVGWYILPLDNSTCDNLSIASYANSAATAAGVNLSAYTR